MAKDAMLEMGLKKMQRRNKKLVDEIAATILLQEYHASNFKFSIRILDAIAGLIILNLQPKY